MLIANPIYDATFKRLMEDDDAAKFLIGTILDCRVIELVTAPQERTRADDEDKKLTLFRMDFVATIVTNDGDEKRVIIELQKAKKLNDVYRFRRYLGHEYITTELPIISIYILGFNLNVDSPAFTASPACRDIRTGEELTVKDFFVTQLTHRAYFIQTKRIKPSLNTRLDELLALFEQAHFIVGDGTKTKEYLLETNDPGIKNMLKVLNYAAADKATREELDKEERYLQAIDDIFGETFKKHAKELEEAMGKLDVANEVISQKDAEIEKLKKLLEAKK